MNACQHCVPVCIKRKGKKNKPREALQNRIVQKSELGLGHIITEEGVSEIKSYDAANRSYKNNGLSVSEVRAKKPRQMGRGLRKQDVKTFLREVVIVGEDLRKTFTTHGLHGDAIREAVCLVGTGLVQGKPLKKQLAGLMDHGDLRRRQQTAHRRSRPLTEKRFPGAVCRQILVKHRIGRIQMMVAKRLGEHDHPLMPLVTGMQKRNPVERIGKQVSHRERFGVP